MRKYLFITCALFIGNFHGMLTATGADSDFIFKSSIQPNVKTVILQPGDTAEPFWVTTTSSVRLFRDMGNASSVILYIPSGETVEVFEEIDDYFSAKYQDEKGYILKKKAKPLNFSEPAESTQRATSPPPRKMNEKDRLIYLKGKYSTKTAESLFKHQIWKGMSTTMAEDSWGAPLTMDRYMGGDEKYEEWKYSRYVLVFNQGRLSGWEKR